MRMKQPVRRIREELYRDRGYDAIWRLPNAGFVLRLDNRYIFLDPVLSSPHRYYEAIRQQIRDTGQLPHHQVELQRHELDTIATEVHEAPLAAEEVEQALMVHPAVVDTVVCGRPSERWGSEVCAVVALRGDVGDDELLATASESIARYKLPKLIVRRDVIVRSPAGKADYRWAREQVADEGS